MTDAEALAQIRAALQEGRAEIAFAPGLGNHMDFPGNSETDKGQFILVALALIALAYWRGSWPVVAGVAVLLVVVYWAYWRKVVRERMRRRFVVKAMADLKPWRKSWTFDGVTLVAAGRECRSPKGDWRAFATALNEAVPAPSASAAESSVSS